MTQSTQAKPVLIVGSVALDTVKTPFGEVRDALGGAAVYSSVAASFFAPVQLVGIVGTDFPEKHLRFLSSRNIDLAGLQRVKGKTFRWAGEYEYDINKRRTLSTELNVFERFRPHIPEAYRDAKYVFLANIDPELQLEVLAQVKNPVLVMCDTMNFWIEGKRDALIEVLKKVDIVLLNDEEARQLCNTPSLVKASRDIRAFGPSVVVIKKGEHGAIMVTDKAHFSAPSYPLEEVADPTGAGDAFAGGFIGYIAATGNTSETNLRKATIYGSTLASFCVEDFSLGRLATLSPEEIVARYCEFRQIAFFEPL
ncbi:MAG: bifunctional hydroxymethylpyrimidine kinase/phosphomethylpyrimidine kinase [Armatimonadetes bacterium]|nr:bifunctional hydroxymethylpyrimidine kinase/phosphomethylpyrimidine kinase [Armatimonadota bacterium]